MGKVIGGRYRLDTESTGLEFGEASIAGDLNSGLEDYVRVYMVRSAKRSELVHNIVQRRANELALMNLPSYLPMSDFGFDGKIYCQCRT
jgi:hypothetical protein